VNKVVAFKTKETNPEQIIPLEEGDFKEFQTKGVPGLLWCCGRVFSGQRRINVNLFCDHHAVATVSFRGFIRWKIKARRENNSGQKRSCRNPDENWESHDRGRIGHGVIEDSSRDSDYPLHGV
jgi:hypothetical protein